MTIQISCRLAGAFEVIVCENITFCSLIFAHMPPPTQKILGKPNLQVKDLLRLPKGATVLGHMGTYLDVLGKYPPSCIEVKTHPDYKFKELEGVRTLKALVEPGPLS